MLANDAGAIAAAQLAIHRSTRSGAIDSEPRLRECGCPGFARSRVHAGFTSSVGVPGSPGSRVHAGFETVQGGGIFKYVDDSASALIASGTTDGGTTALGFTRDVVKFDLKAMTSGNDVTLKFSNIARAQQNTGSAANDGFNPVGMWRGAGAQRIYASLETVAGKIKACLQ